MARCKHNDCFTCPYPDCIAGTSDMRSIPKPKQYDGKKGKCTAKQARLVKFQHKGLKEH